ncbi:unnamed protein product [Adineta steineri]|uniref:Uncharacterized protein n=1 Tax=Adineta steineri TaxID=433720 RepID=A0A815EP23_9BILA|nr:unnamed protein product [Adineta steineri]CAF1580846.1 unnamed protein product [Adineta steineri]
MTCSYMVIWLDANANDGISSFRAKLTEDSSQQVKIFVDADQCVTFIQTNANQKIFFILSGSFGSKVVPLIYDYEHIYQIYIYCASIAKHTSWAIDYTDKILMFEHENDLFERLFNEVVAYLHQQAEQYLKQADQHLKQANLCKDRAQLFKQKPCG